MTLRVAREYELDDDDDDVTMCLYYVVGAQSILPCRSE